MLGLIGLRMWSPERNDLVVRSYRQMWPTEWPGVQMISHSSLPPVMRSPPETYMSGFTTFTRERIDSEPFTMSSSSLVGAPWMRSHSSISDWRLVMFT